MNHFNHKHIKLIHCMLYDTCPPPGAARSLMEPYQRWRSHCCLIEVDLDQRAPFLSWLDQTYISVSLNPSVFYLISPHMNQTTPLPLAINDNASWRRWPLLSLHTHTWVSYPYLPVNAAFLSQTFGLARYCSLHVPHSQLYVCPQWSHNTAVSAAS